MERLVVEAAGGAGNDEGLGDGVSPGRERPANEEDEEILEARSSEGGTPGIQESTEGEQTGLSQGAPRPACGIPSSIYTASKEQCEDGPMNRRDEDRLQELRASLAAVGHFRRGSIQRRLMPCGKPGCCCQANPPKLHGPYYQWTRKVRGKTVTVRLKPNEARLLRSWIANSRRLDKIVAQMERLSYRVTERILAGLRREPRRPRSLQNGET